MRVALYFQDALLRDALHALLTADSFEVVVASSNLQTTVSGCNVHRARVLVFDADSLQGSDLELIKQFSDDSPAEMLALGKDESATEQAHIPFDRYVTFDQTRNKLLKVLNELGGKSARPQGTVREQTPIYGMVTVLTPREHDIALKVAQGISNRDISAELNLAEQTVKNLVSVIMRKMGCSNRTQVAIKLAQTSLSKDS